MEKNRNNNERKICVYHYTVQYFFCSKCDLHSEPTSVVVGKLITNTKALMLGRTHLRRDPRTKSIKSYGGGRGERSLRRHTMYKRWPTIKLTTLFVRESLSAMYDSQPVHIPDLPLMSCFRLSPPTFCAGNFLCLHCWVLQYCLHLLFCQLTPF